MFVLRGEQNGSYFGQAECKVVRGAQLRIVSSRKLVQRSHSVPQLGPFSALPEGPFFLLQPGPRPTGRGRQQAGSGRDRAGMTGRGPLPMTSRRPQSGEGHPTPPPTVGPAGSPRSVWVMLCGHELGPSPRSPSSPQNRIPHTLDTTRPSAHAQPRATSAARGG